MRKISFGEGVERTFATFSPVVGSIKVVRSGKVRRAKLYYLRDRAGKSARIAEKIKKKIGIDVEVNTPQEAQAEVAPEAKVEPALTAKNTETKNKETKIEEKK